MSSHVMDDIETVCDRIVMIHKGNIVVHRSIDDMVKQVEKEIEISVWGGASQMESELSSRGLSVRRMGRNMRVTKVDDNTYTDILSSAAKAGVQVRKMTEYEPDLEDIFLLIMDRLGEEVRETDELMTTSHMGDNV